MIEMLKELDAGWVGAIATVIGVVVAVVIAMAPALIRWMRKRKRNKQPTPLAQAGVPRVEYGARSMFLSNSGIEKARLFHPTGDHLGFLNGYDTMIEMLKELDAGWVGAIATIVGVVVAILLGLLGFELIGSVLAITGIVAIVLAPVVFLLVYWVRESRRNSPSTSPFLETKPTKSPNVQSTSSPNSPTPDHCLVRIRNEEAGFYREKKFRLDSNAQIQTHRLQDILNDIIHMDPEEIDTFDDEYQQELGEYLLTLLLEDFTEPLPPQVEVHIAAATPRPLLLPWHVLAHNRFFLASQGWTVSLSGLQTGQGIWPDCILPDSPRVLLILPEPIAGVASAAEFHLEELERALSARNHTLYRSGNLQVAHVWEAVTEKLNDFSPHVVYFYGACAEGSGEAAERLQLPSLDDKSWRGITPEALATAIGEMPGEPPMLVYLNAADSGAGLVRFGLALEKSVPAVITSRFLYETAIGREQGVKLLVDILTQAIPPHRAVAGLPGRLDSDPSMTSAEIRWMTPLLFRRYGAWRARAAEPLARAIHDPHWHMKIDRVSQFSTVTTQSLQMVREGRPRCLAFAWYGKEGQGMERFHGRLKVELREYLGGFNAHLHEIRPDWPQELVDPEIAFRDCLLEAFEVRTIEDIPAAIRDFTRGASGRRTLVYLRHLPVRSKKPINPAALKSYLRWLDEELVPLLAPNQFLLLGVSFVVTNPAKFRKAVLDKDRLEDLPLKKTVFRLLDEMEELAIRDIVDFFKAHNIHLPSKNRDKAVERILEETGGHYEQTVEALERLVMESWDWEEEEEKSAAEAGEEAYDY